MKIAAPDYVELLELYSRSTRLIGEGDAEGWADLFTAEGVFALPAIEQFGAEAMEVRGRDALLGYIDEVIQGAFDREMGLAPGAKKRYHVSNVSLEAVREGVVEGTAYFLLTVLEAGQPPRVFGSGVYRDRWVKTPGGWKIELRTLTPDL